MALVNLGSSATGLSPHTPPNAAAFTLNTQLQFGPALATAAYYESSIDYYSALSFYYGCVVATAETAASVAASCTITAIGMNRAGNQVASQQFVFQANPAVPKNNMVKGNFNSGFLNVYSINFQVSNNATTAALIDDLIVVLYEKPLAPFY